MFRVWGPYFLGKVRQMMSCQPIQGQKSNTSLSAEFHLLLRYGYRGEGEGGKKF